ncbi:MAG TPA: hypothetical protein VEC35_17105 [Noviherbaspirillum sp.]|nr:hypothetical protein [Noviherbaspirillum sp.]
MPPNLLRQRENSAELMPCSRHSSGTGVPASACLRMAMIWLSVEQTQQTLALLKLLALGQKDIERGEFMDADDFFAQMDKELAE